MKGRKRLIRQGKQHVVGFQKRKATGTRDPPPHDVRLRSPKQAASREHGPGTMTLTKRTMRRRNAWEGYDLVVNIRFTIAYLVMF